MSQTPIARALDKLFDETKQDGTPRFTLVDIHVARSMFLIEIARKGEIDGLSHDRKQELAFLFDMIGLTPNTDPALAPAMIQKYYKSLEINPDLFIEMDRIFKMYAAKGDRVEAMEATEKAYDRLTDKETPNAPQVGEKPPEDTQRAQNLALNLGKKVRI
jgi:hypothetical protein